MLINNIPHSDPHKLLKYVKMYYCCPDNWGRKQTSLIQNDKCDAVTSTLSHIFHLPIFRKRNYSFVMGNVSCKYAEIIAAWQCKHVLLSKCVCVCVCGSTTWLSTNDYKLLFFSSFWRRQRFINIHNLGETSAEHLTRPSQEWLGSPRPLVSPPLSDTCSLDQRYAI